MKNQRLLISLLVVLGVCGFAFSIGVSIFMSYLGSSFGGGFPMMMDLTDLDEPSSLQEPGVHLEMPGLEKSEVYSNAQLDRITDIRLGDYREDPGLEIAVVSQKNAYFTDAEWSEIDSVAFPGEMDHVDLVELPNAGGFAFINRGSWTSDAMFLDADGKQQWRYGGGAGVDDMAAGDLDGDGELDFVVGFNGPGGLHRVDINGERRWKKWGANIWHVEIADSDGEGAMRIVHSDASGLMYVRDANGKRVSSGRPAGYFASFSLCAWPISDGIQYPVYAQNDAIHIKDYDGGTVASFEAPDCGSMGDARATAVRLDPEQASYLACIVDYEGSRASILFVCSAEGDLVHHEVIPESCAAIAAIPSADGASEYFVVGGTVSVWAYTLQAGEPASARG